jgi:FtsP/CotA-like multicopper oxidase with cupredoxin domain
MAKKSEFNLSRRDLLKMSAAAGAATAVGTIAGRPSTASAQVGTTSCTGLQAIEAFPTSPLVLSPFVDVLPVARSASPVDPSSWTNKPGSGAGQQDSAGHTHQLYPGQGVVANYPNPIVYQNKLQVAPASFSTSAVRTLVGYTDTKGNIVPAGTVVPSLPKSAIYAFNSMFPGPRINAEYGKPCLVRFENHLDENPYNLDRQDFGAPNWTFLTHLHNGHTASESDGNPHHKPDAYSPGEWVDNLYLNYPAGGLEAEKQSFFWYHDHKMDHTGANVYKGMAGIFPIYDPVLDPGDEKAGLHLPGVRVNKAGQPVGAAGYDADGSFDVDYDIPLVFYDCRLDDGVTPHQDFHNGCGEFHPEWWGKLFFRHYPNHGFVGDIFTTNGVAYPQYEVKRRKYRFRLLTASISRDYEFMFMTSKGGPKASVSLGYAGDELQGQYRIEDGQQCLRFVEIATGGGLLPFPILRDSIENWPAMRHEIVVDFTRYMDGTPTKKGDAIYLTNIMKMPDGRKPTTGTRFGIDQKYKVPMVKFVVGDVAEDNSDLGLSANSFNANKSLRPQPFFPAVADMGKYPQRTFELQRGGFGGEIQWLINGHPFDPTVPLATVKQGVPEVWNLKNGGGGWVHPMHLHMEEHHMLLRGGKPATSVAGHQDDTGKDDVIALDPAEDTFLFRNFRTFTGKYVAHCHNLAHEDHAMMFGWVLSK